MDENLNALPPAARWTWAQLILEADDDGRLQGSLAYLWGAIYPDESVSLGVFQKHLTAIVKQGLAHQYETAGIKYLHLPKFSEHQKITHKTPSKLPEPSCCFPESFRKDSGAPPELPPKDSGLEVEVERESSSSSTTSRLGDRSPDDDENTSLKTPAQTVYAACRLLAEGDLKTTPSKVRFRESWLRTATQRRLDEHGVALAGLLQLNPGLTPEQLVGMIDRQSEPRNGFAPRDFCGGCEEGWVWIDVEANAGHMCDCQKVSA